MDEEKPDLASASASGGCYGTESEREGGVRGGYDGNVSVSVAGGQDEGNCCDKNGDIHVDDGGKCPPRPPPGDDVVHEWVEDDDKPSAINENDGNDGGIEEGAVSGAEALGGDELGPLGHPPASVDDADAEAANSPNANPSRAETRPGAYSIPGPDIAPPPPNLRRQVATATTSASSGWGVETNLDAEVSPVAAYTAELEATLVSDREVVIATPLPEDSHPITNADLASGGHQGRDGGVSASQDHDDIGGEASDDGKWGRGRGRRRQLVCLATLVALALLVIVGTIFGTRDRNRNGSWAVVGGAGGDGTESGKTKTGAGTGTGTAVVATYGGVATSPSGTTSSYDCALGYRPTCGSCWCAFSDYAPEGVEVSCPPFPEGWLSPCVDRFHTLAELYGTFVLDDSSRAELVRGHPTWDDGGWLLNDRGERCNPASFHLGPGDLNPWSGLPPCFVDQYPRGEEENDNVFGIESVCAFKYIDAVESVETCRGRTYQIGSYRTWGDALEDGASVTHLGVCGACSTARDFAAILQDNFHEQISQCILESGFDAPEADDGSAANPPAFGGNDGDDDDNYNKNESRRHRYAELKKIRACFESTIGMTPPCSTVYSAWVLLKRTFCREECRRASSDPLRTRWWLGGSPPACPASEDECLTCLTNQRVFGLSVFFGRGEITSSVVNDNRISCGTTSVLPTVVHDPCDGLV